MNSQEYMARTEQVVLHTYNRFPVVFESAEGVWLTDVEGKKYLDFGAGIAVFALGYGNKAYEKALKIARRIYAPDARQLQEIEEKLKSIGCDRGTL